MDKWEVWLSATPSTVSGKDWHHVLLVENTEEREEFLPSLRAYAEWAHKPAVRRLRAPFQESLEPDGSLADPAAGYPAALDAITLQGYLGELIAGAVASHCSHVGEEWEVPAYLFHGHDLAFHELDRINQTGGKSKKIFGRTGDDCLAFRRDDQGRVTGVMHCEAKLTKSHDSKMIKENLKKLSEGLPRPVDIQRVIEALRYLDGDDLIEGWILSLQEYYFAGDPEERVDMSSYACGKHPVKDPTWIDLTKHPAEHTADRWLVAVEVHLQDVSDLVTKVYKET